MEQAGEESDKRLRLARLQMYGYNNGFNINSALKSAIFEDSRYFFTIEDSRFIFNAKYIRNVWGEQRFALYVLAHSKRMLPSNNVVNRYRFSVMQMFKMYLRSTELFYLGIPLRASVGARVRLTLSKIQNNTSMR